MRILQRCSIVIEQSFKTERSCDPFQNKFVFYNHHVRSSCPHPPLTSWSNWKSGQLMPATQRGAVEKNQASHRSDLHLTTKSSDSQHMSSMQTPDTQNPTQNPDSRYRSGGIHSSVRSVAFLHRVTLGSLTFLCDREMYLWSTFAYVHVLMCTTVCFCARARACVSWLSSNGHKSSSKAYLIFVHQTPP